jgi:AbrB family looped-hinge helix DNA binding protein
MATETSVEETKVNDSGMVTLPAALRRRLDIEAGDKLRWTVDEDDELHVTVVRERYGAFEDAPTASFDSDPFGSRFGPDESPFNSSDTPDADPFDTESTANEDPFNSSDTPDADPFDTKSTANEDPFNSSDTPDADPFDTKSTANEDPFNDSRSDADPFTSEETTENDNDEEKRED